MSSSFVAPEVAFDKIACFETANELAEYFKAEGIKGYRSQHDACPIARWLSCTTGREASVATFIIIDSYDDSLVFTTTATDSMVAFMDTFDHGGFPELIDMEVGLNGSNS